MRLELKPWNLRLVSVVGLVLGAGVWLYGNLLVWCSEASVQDIPTLTCSPKTLEPMGAFVALFFSVVLAYSILRNPLTTKGGTAS